MNDEDYLELAKDACLAALVELDDKTNYYRSLPLAIDKREIRELKSGIDRILEAKITNRLSETKIPILSEEYGGKQKLLQVGLQWIVDPLDGTVNWFRGEGPCSISIALFNDGRPLFGVIAEYPSRNVFWGGKSFGAHVGDKKISALSADTLSQRILYSGFPSGTNFLDIFHLKVFDKFKKVRMIGCASMSLVKVASQLGDCYYEDQIKIWDVAAGLAIIEGAGGCCKVNWPFKGSVCLSVVAGDIAIISSLCGPGGLFENWSVL